MKKAYLVLYNLASCIGWAYIIYLIAQSVQRGDSPQQFWNRAGDTVKIVQSAAALELVHSLLGLVPSPFATALPQVASRLLLVWVYSARIADAQKHWSIYLMVGSWALVEVPRYLFYVWNIVAKTTPGPLFFLRYTLFMVLYPSGITGEVMQIVSSMPFLKATSLPLWYASLFALVLYLPGSPYMYTHMMTQRKRASAKRAEAARGPAPEIGLLFPKDKKGERASSAIGKAAFAASARAAGAALPAEEVERERNWRFGYAKHVIKNVKLCAKDTKTCLKAAEGGLTYLHENFDFARDGKTLKLAEAMKTIKGSFLTREIVGRGRRPEKFVLDVPYKGQRLTGAALKQQLDRWVEYGTIEPEAGKAIWHVANDKDGLLDLSDSYFVLLGAGSAMGPLLVLLSLGANVIAVDLDRTAIWRRLLQLASDSCGKMIFPLKKEMPEKATIDELAEQAGCNLFTQTPEICNWLKTVAPSQRLIIGAYAYLDGAAHVQVALAMDAIMAGVCEARKDTGLAYLCSPTDVFIRPEAAHRASEKNLRSAPIWQKLISTIAGGKALVPSPQPSVMSDDGPLYLVDGIVVAQGPNYALAKRLQHWRAMLARSRGHVVSSNIAPSTRTVSVVHNKQFAAAYDGMHLFKPMEIMYQETSNAVMAALLIHDFKNPASFSHPNDKHPLLLFADGSFHGGVWRIGYKINSIGVIAALSTYLRQYGVPLFASVAGIGATVGYAVKNKVAPHHFF